MKNQRMNERTRRQGKSKAEQQQQQQQKAIFTNRKVWNWRACVLQMNIRISFISRAIIHTLIIMGRTKCCWKAKIINL